MASALPLGFRFAEEPELLLCDSPQNGAYPSSESSFPDPSNAGAALCGRQGFPRGRISEIYGPSSSGRTGLAHSALAASTERGECAALIDTANAFDLCSAAAAGVKLEKLLWVRCGGNAEHAMRAADLLLQAGGFGVVVLDLIGASQQALARIPPTAWFRFRRTIEPMQTVFLVLADKPLTKSCAAKRVALERKKPVFAGAAPFKILKAS